MEPEDPRFKYDDSDSESEDYAPEAKRQKRHKFKTFSQRVADVDVDVYRSLGPKRCEPLGGASSFFQERLEAWRELNAAHDWLEAIQLLHPLCHTLPQLLHHQTDILDILLSRITLAASLSLEPLLELIGALARDLQADFLPHVGRVLTVFSDFVESGGDREPELLQHLFTAVSLVCKHLCAQLAADLAPVLAASTRLRYHRAPHVRILAAQSFGFLLRQAAPGTARSAVRSVLADAAMRPSVARIDGAGLLVAEAATGLGNGLHSRGPALLSLLLQPDILTPGDFQAEKKKSAGRNREGTDASAPQQSRFSAETLAARVAAVAAACLERLLLHIRRGPTGRPLWESVLTAATERVNAFVAATPSTSSRSGNGSVMKAKPAMGKRKGVTAEEGSGAADVTLVAANAARGLALLALMLEHHRGGRVEDYSPLFALANRVAGAEVLGRCKVDAPDASGDEVNESEEGPEGSAFSKYLEPSLSGQVLRILQALVFSHCRAVGASLGPPAIERVAPLWVGAFSSSLPQGEVLGFVRALVTPPAGTEMARGFGPHMVAAVGRSLLAGERTDECWPLLMDLCSALGGGATSGAVPLLMTASGGLGPRLSTLVCDTVRSFTPAGDSAAFGAAWAALHCLPHAVAKPQHATRHVEALLAASATALTALQGTPRFQEALVLHCAAAAAAAAALQKQPGAELQEREELAQGALNLVRTYPSHYHAVHAAAEMLQAAGDLLPASQLEELAPAVAPNLSSPCAPLRIATLRLLCAFPQPPSEPSTGDASAAAAEPQLPCDVLQQLLSVETRPLGADTGRAVSVATGRVKTLLEYRRVPLLLVPLAVRSLMGLLHVRFAAMWPPAASALAAALESYPTLAWPLVMEALEGAQLAFLAGDCQAKSNAGGAAAAADAAAEAGALELDQRFAAETQQGSSVAAGGSTDAEARLTHLLRALTTAAKAGGVEGRSKRWVPLFLAYSTARALEESGEEEEEDEVEVAEQDGDAAGEEGEEEEAPQQQAAHVPPRAWRFGLKEWLALLAAVKGIRGVPSAASVRRSVAVHCLDVDPTVQAAALKGLRAFKLPWLTPYTDRLLRLADNKTLRSELTAFPLAVDPTSVRKGDEVDAIAPDHRAPLVPLVIALLFPKMRKRSGRLGGKGAPGSARAAILNFLAGAEPAELRPLLELFLGPLSPVFVRPLGHKDEPSPASPHTEDHPPGCGQWWGAQLGRRSGEFWLAAIDSGALTAQPLRRRVGYLNALEDLLKHLGHRMEAYLPELLSLTVILLEGATTKAALGDAKSVSGEGGKEVRSRCLRLLAGTLERFPTSINYGFMWQRLLRAAAPLGERIAAEVSADRPPPLVELAAALATSPVLVGVLGDGVLTIVQREGGESTAELAASSQSWAAEAHLGSALLGRCVAALSSPACAEPSRVALLSMLESLFDLPDPTGDLLLEPHLPSLLIGLQAVVVAAWKNAGKATFSKTKRLLGATKQPEAPRRHTAARALAILELVGGRASDWGTAAQLTDALLPLLAPHGGGKKKSSDEVMVARTLGALTALWLRLGDMKGGDQAPDVQGQEQRLRAIAAALGPLAGVLSTPDAKEALCSMLRAVGGLLPELERPAALLTGLNAMSAEQLDEPDYETRMATYGELTAAVWSEFTPLGAALVVQHCARDLRNAEDLALRHAGAQALANLVDAAGAAEPTAGVVAVAQRQLFTQLKRSVGASALSVRQEHLTLIRRLALAMPLTYADLLPLTHQEAEADFLLNSVHLQLHRRARAFTRLARMLKDPDTPPLSIPVLVGVVGPLLQQAIVEGRMDDAPSSGHDAKQADKDRGTGVVDAAILALGAVAGALPWVQYHQLLGQYLRLMKRHAEGTPAKAVLRATCSLLDAFHFFNDQEEGERPEGQDAPQAMDEGGKEAEEEAEEGEDGDVIIATTTAPFVPPREEIYRLLTKRVVPELRAQLVVGENVRAPVGQALVKVLKLLPPEKMRAELPRTLQSVANLLKLRLQSLRDNARSVLVAMATDLGPEYLPFTLEVLASALPPKGFTAHVLGYTVHSVLEGVAPASAEEPGALNDCLHLILPVIEGDLFGDVAEAKEVAAFAASYKEAKRCRANDTFQLLASRITFSSHIQKLLGPVRSRLGDASNPKIRSKLALLLQHASAGVLTNPTAKPRDLCELVHAVASAGLAAEEAAKAQAAAASGAAERGQGLSAAHDASEVSKVALHQQLLVEFALSTLKAALKKGIVPVQGPEATALLDPLLPLLVRALRSRHTPTVTAALQSLSLLIVQADLPGMGPASKDAGKAVTELLKRCPKTTHPVAQDCFKLLAGMLRACETYSPSSSQLRFLLGWAFTDLEESAQRQTAFTLLRAILARKLVLPEVYDLMERVQELMVRSQAAAVRQLASSSLLAFLLDYPLGPKRLQGHLAFVLTNLAYEHETGREAALSMLSAMVGKFPEEVVAGWAETIFLPLVTRLVNDQSTKCRTAAGACTAALLQRLPAAARDRQAAYCSQWLRGGDPRLVRAAAQALGILVEVEGAAAKRRLPELLPAVAAVLRARVAAQEESSDEEEDEVDPAAAAAGWQEAYYCMCFLEKVAVAAPEALAWTAGSDSQACWAAAAALLLHRHAWVRKAAARMVGAGLADAGVGPLLLASADATRPGALALSFFRQLDCSADDEELAAQAVKCLVFLALPMYESDQAAGRVKQPAAEEGEAMAEEEEEEEEEGEIEEAADAAGAAGESLTVHGLVRRVARLADDKSYARQLQRGVALRFIAAVASRLGPSRVEPYLPALLRPLYRITEPQATGNTVEAKALGDEVVAHLRALVGSETLLSAYNRARTAVVTQRGERKRRAAVLTLVDPEAAAKRKIRSAERKAASKRKAAEEVRRQRSAGVVVKNKKMRGAGERY